MDTEALDGVTEVNEQISFCFGCAKLQSAPALAVTANSVAVTADSVAVNTKSFAVVANSVSVNANSDVFGAFSLPHTVYLSAFASIFHLKSGAVPTAGNHTLHTTSIFSLTEEKNYYNVNKCSLPFTQSFLGYKIKT